MVELKTNTRTELRRVVIETPALLNLVKHCRDADTSATATQGFLMGVTKQIEGETENSLLVTQTMPKANKAQMAQLLKTLENESQRLMDTNEIGFYLNSRMGLAFNREVLSQLIESQRKFKNSIFIVYDTAKANFGLNPLKAYRLSERALEAFNQDHGSVQMVITQERLLKLNLTASELYEEIPIRVQRNHMQQAYLFDYIRPEMPAFNTNVFKLAQPAYFESHVHQAAEVTEQFVASESYRMDQAFKAYQKVRKNQITNSTFKKVMTTIGEDDTRHNKLDYLLLSKQVDALCGQVDGFGISGPQELAVPAEAAQ